MTREEYKKWLLEEQKKWQDKADPGIVRRTFSPSAPAELSQEGYQEWLADTDKPWDHSQVSGGRLKLRFRGQPVPPVSSETEERLVSGWRPTDARTQSVAVHAISRERQGEKQSRDKARKERISSSERDIAAALTKYRNYYLSEQKRTSFSPMESSTRIPADPEVLLGFGMPRPAAEYLCNVAGGRVFLAKPERAGSESATAGSVAVAAAFYRFFGSPFGWDSNSPPFYLSLRFPRNTRGLKANPEVISFLKENKSESLYLTLYLSSIEVNGTRLPLTFARKLKMKALLMAGSPPEEYTEEWLPVVPLAFVGLMAEEIKRVVSPTTVTLSFLVATTGARVRFSVPVQHSKPGEKGAGGRPPDYDTLRYAYYEDLPSLLARGLHKRRYQKRTRVPFTPTSHLARENPVQIVVDYSQYADLEPETYREIPSKPTYGVYKNARGELQVASIKRIKTWLGIAQFGKSRKKEKSGSPGASDSVHPFSEKNPMAGKKLKNLRAEFGPTARISRAPSLLLGSEFRTAASVSAAAGSNATRYRMRQQGFDPLAQLRASLEDEFGPGARAVDPGASLDPMAAARASVDYRARPQRKRRDSVRSEYGPNARAVPSGPYLPRRIGYDDDPYSSAVGEFGLQQFVPVNRRSNPRKDGSLTRKERSRRHNAQSHHSELAAAAMRIKHAQGVSLKEAWQIARSTGSRQAVANPTYFPDLDAMGMTGVLGQQAAHPVSRRNGGKSKARPNISKCAALARANPSGEAHSMMDDLVDKGYATKGDVRAMRELCGAGQGGSQGASRPTARETRQSGSRPSARTGRLGPKGGRRR